MQILINMFGFKLDRLNSAILLTSLTIFGSFNASGISGNGVELNIHDQAGTKLCYAFSEEQMLRDLSCKKDCEHNIGEWKYSIFDIARAHQSHWLKTFKNSITADPSRDLLGNGSSFAFPYVEQNLKDVRASKCTLEKELFFLNRSQQSSPKLIMADYLTQVYLEFAAGQNPNSPSQIPEIEEAWNILKTLAGESRDEYEFLEKTISFTRCPDRETIPPFKPVRRLLTEKDEIRKLIRLQLAKHRSVYVGVCEHVLKGENIDAGTCRAHAIVLKRRDKKTKSILIIDSAFISQGLQNLDGSIWLPEEVVVDAVAAHGRDIVTRVSSNNQPTDFSNAARDSISSFKKMLAEVRGDQRQALADSYFESLLNHYGDGTKGRRLIERLRTRFRQKDFNLSEIDQLTPILEKKLQETLGQQPSGILSGIVWLEQ